MWGRIFLLEALFAIFAIIYIVPSPEGIHPFHPAPMPAFKGPLAVNNHLLKARTLYKGQLHGPEKFVKHPHNNDVYTASNDGQIVRIRNGKAENLTKVQQSKPNGFDFDANGNMIIADPWSGRLYELDLRTMKDKHLTSYYDNQQLHFINDVAVGPNRTIYFTESTQKHLFEYHTLHLPCIEHASDGRVLSYDPETKAVYEIMRGLNFANGIVLSHDKESLLVVDMGSYRIMRLYIHGKKRGLQEVWADNLPGFADDITRSPSGGYWVAFYALRDVGLDFLHPYPKLKKLLTYVPHTLLTRSQYGLLVHFSENGTITQSLHDPTGENVYRSTSVLQLGNDLWIGNLYQPYMKLYTLED